MVLWFVDVSTTPIPAGPRALYITPGTAPVSPRTTNSRITRVHETGAGPDQALAPILGYLRELRVAPEPVQVVAVSPADVLLDRFARYLTDGAEFNPVRSHPSETVHPAELHRRTGSNPSERRSQD